MQEKPRPQVEEPVWVPSKYDTSRANKGLLLTPNWPDICSEGILDMTNNDNNTINNTNYYQ